MAGRLFPVVNVNAGTFASTVSNGVGGVGLVSINSPNTITLSGVLSDGANGQLAITQSGAGTTVLTNTNTYTGPTTVNAGRLVVNGILAPSNSSTSAVTVNKGGTLAGTGTINGQVTILTGGNLNPGSILESGRH